MSSPLRSGLLLAVLLLAACSATPDKRPDSCPRVALLADAADLVRYRGAGRDVTDLLLMARITAVPATCANGGDGIVDTTLRISDTVVRGPAAPGRAASITPFISVVEGDRLLDQLDYPQAIVFPPNQDRVALTSGEIVLHIPNTADHPASTKRVLIGFRLTPEELAINRKHASP